MKHRLFLLFCDRQRAWQMALLLLVLVAGSATACDTPVYRYAMYRWEPADYIVYHFHKGGVSPSFVEVKEKLLAARQDPTSAANVYVQLVNVDEDPQLERVPPEVRKLRETHPATPLTLVVNPLGLKVFDGDLTAADVEAMLTGAPRDAIGKLLSEGNAGVFVLLLGDDAQANAAAEQLAAKHVADVNEGKLSLYRKPDEFSPLPVGSPEAAKEDTSKEPPISIATLSFTREQLAQQDPWLLKDLLAAESDLAKRAGEPMLFVVYGRGRALPPYVGKGITKENLFDVTDFVTGACSCTVKEQNPGVDLLMRFDWEAAATAIAKKFGSEEGSEALGDLFPQLIPQLTPTSPEKVNFPTSDDVVVNSISIAPPETTATQPTASSTQPIAAAESPPASSSKLSTEEKAKDSDAAGETKVDAEVDPQVVERNEVLAKIDERYTPLPTATEVTAVPVASPQLLVPLGIGLAIGLVALVAVTFLVLKPQ